MKMYIKVYSEQSGADLSTKEFDVDELIGVLQSAKSKAGSSHKIKIMCDDWHRGGYVGSSHSRHVGKLEFSFYE